MSDPERTQTLPLGVVLRKTAGVTRWQPWVWRAVGVLPGAGPAEWREIRTEAGVTDYHAATPVLELHRADTEAYLHELNALSPSVYIILRETDTTPSLQVARVTVSPYEAQDYTDSSEEIVEKVPMPPALLEFVRAFIDRHHRSDPFVKRKRDRMRVDQVEDGIGDPRVQKEADIYASPALRRRRLQ